MTLTDKLLTKCWRSIARRYRTQHDPVGPVRTESTVVGRSVLQRRELHNLMGKVRREVPLGRAWLKFVRVEVQETRLPKK